jgi:hypothetical protein
VQRLKLRVDLVTHLLEPLREGVGDLERTQQAARRWRVMDPLLRVFLSERV